MHCIPKPSRIRVLSGKVFHCTGAQSHNYGKKVSFQQEIFWFWCQLRYFFFSNLIPFSCFQVKTILSIKLKHKMQKHKKNAKTLKKNIKCKKIITQIQMSWLLTLHIIQKVYSDWLLLFIEVSKINKMNIKAEKKLTATEDSSSRVSVSTSTMDNSYSTDYHTYW